MLTQKNYLKMNTNTNDGGGGGTGGQQTQQQGTQANSQNSKENGNSEQRQSQQQQAAQNQAGKENGQSQQNQTPQKSLSGYSESDDQSSTASGYTQEGTVNNQQPEDKKAIKLDYDLKTEGLDDVSSSIVKEFAAKHKLPKEAAEALVELKKIEDQAFNNSIEEMKKESEKRAKDQRANWYKELKEHKEFGGEKYWHNHKQVDKVIEKVLPNTKLMLDKHKAVLPPEVVIDLFNLSKMLFKNDKFVGGEDGQASQPNSEKAFLDRWYKQT